MPVRSTKQLIELTERSDQTLARIRRELEAEVAVWEALIKDHIEERLSNTARIANVPEPVIGEYVGSIAASIDRIVAGLKSDIENLRNASITMGSLSHCASALRHKAQQARANRNAGDFVL
jgi:hypothetical protein